MTTLTTGRLPASPAQGWNIGLWAAQIALALLYLMAAYMHGVMSPAALVAMGAVWAAEAPLWLLRFIGAAELLGAIGVILPAATRIAPRLTLWAAAGLLAIQALAIPFHALRGEWAALPFNLIYVALALLVFWGRAHKSPIAAR